MNWGAPARPNSSRSLASPSRVTKRRGHPQASEHTRESGGREGHGPARASCDMLSGARNRRAGSSVFPHDQAERRLPMKFTFRKTALALGLVAGAAFLTAPAVM